jgi:SRSO17 transposase
MCPLYVSGLIGPGDRKSIQPMAKRLALGACDQLHHFIAAGSGIGSVAFTRESANAEIAP